MPIISKPSVTKGTPFTMSLDKSALAAHSMVSADSYFSDSSKWGKVIVYYKNAEGQRKAVSFDPSVSSPSKSVVFSQYARSSFQVSKVVIFDKEGGSLKIPRANLTASEFDISFGGGGGTPVTALFTRDFASPSSAIPDEYMTGTGLGNNISNNVLNLYVPDSGYNGSLYYAMNPFPYSFASGKTYKIRLTFSEAPSSNARFQANWNNGNGSLYRVFTQEELSQGFVELTGVTSASTYLGLSCNTTDAAAAYIRFSKYEVFEV